MDGPVLMVLTGSSASGKTTLAKAVTHLRPDLVVHDFDEVGVPDSPDRWWRQRTLEEWVRLAARHEGEGLHVLLTGQSPLGEVLAVPSAPALGGIAACLIDVADSVRLERLSARGDNQPAPTSDVLRWADWQRHHAREPQHEPSVLTEDSWPEMCWGRWSRWSSADPRWAVGEIETTGVTVSDSARELAGWIESQVAALLDGSLPLRRGWADSA